MISRVRRSARRHIWTLGCAVTGVGGAAILEAINMSWR
jgi:hypothetical protein